MKLMIHSYQGLQEKERKIFSQNKSGHCEQNMEANYQVIVRQVIAGETDLLNDLSYDPVIL